MRWSRIRLMQLVAGLVCAVLFAGPSAAAGPEVVELAPDVYAFIGEKGGTNSGFVVTDEGVVVIDTQGPRELAQLLKEKVREVTDKPVAFVVNTHYHGDHTFGNQYFNEARAIISHDETLRALVETDSAHRARFRKFFGEESLVGFNPKLPDVTFTDRVRLKAGKTVFELVHPGPAHTLGDVYVYLPQHRVLFAGDLLYRERLPLLGDGDTAGAVAALDDLLYTGARVYLPGHGTVADRGDVVEYRRFLVALRAEVARMRAEGMSVEEVAERIDLPEYSGYVMYDEWLGRDARAVYEEFEGGGGYIER